MKLSKLTKSEEERLIHYFESSLLSHPLFMYYCPDKTKRAQYIRAYFDYHLPFWAKEKNALLSPQKHVVAALVDKNAFTYSLSGMKAWKLSLNYEMKRIRLHRKVTHNIVGVMVPADMPVRVLTIFGNAQTDLSEVLAVVQEAQERAESEGFVLVYETFSRRLITEMEQLGFEMGYQRNFMDTRFVQTLMTYNI